MGRVYRMNLEDQIACPGQRGIGEQALDHVVGSSDMDIEIGNQVGQGAAVNGVSAGDEAIDGGGQADFRVAQGFRPGVGDE